MKALFNRLNRGKEKEKTPKEKPIDLPPLPDWPPRPKTNSTTSPATPTAKPLPDLSPRSPPTPDLPPTAPTHSAQPAPTRAPQTPRPEHDALGLTGTSSVVSTRAAPSEQYPSPTPTRKTTNASAVSTTGASDAPKKVAFISPPPTPGPVPRTMSPETTPDGPAKNQVSRFKDIYGKEVGKDSRSSSSSPKLDLLSKSAMKATSTRNVVSPTRNFTDSASLHQSVRSGTPYSQTSGNTSSRILAPASWSETAEEDLVTNLGSRERTRQEVLWEIVASEERYVAELIKMNETFIEPLLHPFSAQTQGSSPMVDLDDYNRPQSPPRVASPQESLDHLPIAARFLTSPLGIRSDSPPLMPGNASTKDDAPMIDGDSGDSDDDEADDRMGRGMRQSGKSSALSKAAAKHNHPRSPYGAHSKAAVGKTGKAVPFPSRSHQSLPPPPRSHAHATSTTSLGRQSVPPDHADRRATTSSSSKSTRKLKKSAPTSPSKELKDAVAPHQLPEDLRECLEAIENVILNGHLALSEALRKRYDDQYPLVRSLADVFVSHSHILQGYATYVLHLERALEQVDNALSNAAVSKKPKNQDAAEWLKVCKYLQKLEESAADKGETGLAISLSKPFQRLLKYPLLFQNLLFHTDPSTFEYESTLQMVAEVETIVRSIEDEKIQKEERDKTRDVFARIEGLEKVKQLAIPKPSRLLLEERIVVEGGSLSPTGPPSVKPSSPPPVAVKGKSSFKRLSDVLGSNGANGVGGKRDLWLVVFNDVVLRCQRTGTTSLPLVSVTNSRTTSMPELQGKAGQGKSKYATTGRRNSHTKPRNLYKFIKIETWEVGKALQAREGVVKMDEVARAHTQAHASFRSVPMPEDDEDDGAESDESDRKSKMSFSYWGADKVTIQKPIVKSRYMQAHTPPTRRPPGAKPSSYGRESSANAKFGHRLLSENSSTAPTRPASRRTQTATPTLRRAPLSEDTQSLKATVTSNRPAWDSSIRSPTGSTTSPPVAGSRSRNVSQTSKATSTKVASPAPSEDSGVGLYRQMMANNPSLNKLS